MDSLERLICQITGASGATRGDPIQSLWSGYGELTKARLTQAEPSHVVVKHVRPPQTTHRGNAEQSERSHARKLRSYGVEMQWYEQYAAHCGAGCRVPRNLGCRNLAGTWVFVLEDLDAAGFSKRLTSPNDGEVKAVLRWLAVFHATFFGRSPNGLWNCGSYWHLATRTEELSKVRESTLRKAAPKLDRCLNTAKYQTFIHGDAKLDNFCFSSRPEDTVYDPTRETASVAAVDFQYVGRGCGMKDVAYFFSSIWNANACNAFAEEALDYYFERLRAALCLHSPDTDPLSVEQEWRALYPVAWADFQRFLCGWAPGHYDDDPYARRMLEQALANL